jgi:calcineurin-like phosphoesterase family protein
MKTLVFDNPDKLYFTSDLHLCHENVIRYCSRPFQDVEEMNSVIVDNWNNTIKSDDLVFILGDFCWRMGSSSIRWYLNRLVGRKIIVLGNHDKNEKVFVGLAEQVYDGIVNIRVKDSDSKDAGYQRITLCHYPMLSWYQSHRGAWQFFGHMHNTTLHPLKENIEGGDEVADFLKTEYHYIDKIRFDQYDVGVDGNNFTPISYYDIKKKILKNLEIKK